VVADAHSLPTGETVRALVVHARLMLAGKSPCFQCATWSVRSARQVSGLNLYVSQMVPK
jgi:hypothetical protein